jgi:4-amino-4-deoxy-L-arabinose transferase-like glycosyltransferase
MAGELELKSEKEIFPFILKHWKILLLIAILILTFYLRFYHVDYPVVGYHDWKETHYLTESRNFAEEGFFQYGFFMPFVDFLTLGGDPNGVHSDSLPTLSIILGFLFNIFGSSLLLARFVTILFSVGAVLFLYLFMKELTKNEYLSFASAFALAITPLSVFFGRNVQLINPALFFMLATFYFYTKWIKTDKSKLMILTAVSLALCILTKYSFFLVVFPMLFMFPYKRLKKVKEKSKSYLISALALLSIPLWFFYSDIYMAKKLGQSGAVASRIFDFSSFPQIWEIFKVFIPDNYTWIGFLFAIVGLVLFFVFYKKGRLFNKFILGYLVGIIIWLIFMAGKLEGHSYHHYPLLPLFAILVGFAVLMVSNVVAKFVAALSNKKIKVKHLRILLILLLFFLLWSPSMEAKDKQFNTQFFGLDVAGDYVRENSEVTDKMFHSTHQSHGVLWHANRQGYGLPDSIDKLREGEQNGANWLFVYQWGFNIMNNPELWEEVKSTYSLRQVAFLQQGEQVSPIYFLLEKGGSFDEDELNTMIADKEIKIRNYEYTNGGQIPLTYIDL